MARHDHQAIYRSLTVQMLLPLAYIFGATAFILDALGLVHSRTLQRSITVVSERFKVVLFMAHYDEMKNAKQMKLLKVKIKSQFR